MAFNNNITVTGNEAYFNEDVKFFKDVHIYGKLYYDFLKDGTLEFPNVNIRGDLNVYGRASFWKSVYIEGDLDAGIITARKRLDVGVGGTTLRADASNGKVGIGSTVPRQNLDVVGIGIFSDKVGIGGTVIPQQTLEINGSVKIDRFIYDSQNTPGKNGYYLARDVTGVRWIPIVVYPPGGGPGISSEGIIVLDDGIVLQSP